MKVFTNNLRVILGNSRLAKLIKKGILRIFPRPVLYILAIVVACTLFGCATPAKVSQLVKDVRIDTLYLSNTKYDSIYIYKEHSSDFKPSSLNREERGGSDTVYIKDVSVEYRYKLLRDTVKVIQRDSIPYQVTVIETEEITRPLTLFDHLTRSVFWILTGILFVLFARFVVSKNVN